MSYVVLSTCCAGSITFHTGGQTGSLVTVEIIILAMVAAFLGLRLYSVLGKRTGHEQEPLTRGMDTPVTKRPTAMERPQLDDKPAALTPGTSTVFDIAAEPGIRQMLAADRSFDVARFREGAKAAYGMILEAFWSGDREQLRSLCDEEVYESFAESIDQRTARGETLENRLVRIDESRIIDAEYDAPMARITVRFDSDIAAVVRGPDGELVAGSLTDAVETHDVWTFQRDLRSNDPNWILVETDQA
ncbi:putative lipid-binding transport protein (Tim44 family) [Blastomonas natatoria]|uniref:Putative lipid-binding transport protein (Tim44 family) n=1 Tax=Blastomonas natatoria TaxID=34015 RepID=A0A2V3UN54_9SPHN|nr:putative lipid-binding transport protein (Tim44 family) [Blastomonas natatoria]